MPLCFSCKDEEKESLVLLNFSQILKDHNEAFYEKFVKREVVEDATLDQFYGTGLLKHVSISRCFSLPIQSCSHIWAGSSKFGMRAAKVQASLRIRSLARTFAARSYKQ